VIPAAQYAGQVLVPNHAPIAAMVRRRACTRDGRVAPTRSD